MKSYPIVLLPLMLSACSVIVPGPEDFTYGLVDAGLMDSGSVPLSDAGPSCTSEVCNGFDDDCDGRSDEGPAQDSCLPAANVDSAACVAGTCMVDTCADGFGDCDGHADNGCEVTLGTTTNCLSCGDVCAWTCDEIGCNDPVDLAAGGRHACVVRADGTAYCWGANGSGQLGDGTTSDSSRPVRVRGLMGAALVGPGEGHSCAITADQAVYCWGANEAGQTGSGFMTDPTESATVVNGLRGYSRVAGGRDLSCAATADGVTTCWGQEGDGRLGDGTSAYGRRDRPGVSVAVVADTRALGLGLTYACAARRSGGIWCWGFFQEELANRVILTPEQLTAGTFIDVAAGQWNVCGVTDVGTVACQGDNSGGQLGTGNNLSSPDAFVVVAGIATAENVTVGTLHACVRLASGQVQCWGEGGRVGDGTTFQRREPTEVSLEDVITVSAGDNFTCALQASGGVACWGRNESGQLGDGTNTPRPGPVPVIPPLEP